MDLTLRVFVFLTGAAQVVSHRLELPARVVFKLGGRRELRCAVRSCPREPSFAWVQLQDKPLFTTTRNQHQQSVMIFDSVTRNHDTVVLCRATCGPTTKQAKAAIHVYSSPGKPVLSGNDHMILGEENLLTCQVRDAYPPELLEVEWMYGDTVLHREEGEPGDENFKSSYTFRPSSEDDGKIITCKASLNLEGVPPDEMFTETSGLLRVLSAPHNVRVSGEPAVPLGSSLTLTCEAEGTPDLKFRWTALKQDGGSVDMGNRQELFVQTVSLSDAGVYQCEVNNQLGRQTASISVVVQAPPMNTRIKATPQSVLREGESVSIFCMSDGAPVEHVELRRTVDGIETQLKISVGSETSVTLDSVKLDDSGLYVCEAFNEFGSEKIALHLIIEAPRMNTTAEVFPSSDIQGVQNITICCMTDSFSPPAVVLRRPESDSVIYSPEGVFNIINPSRNDTGSYQTNITSDLGYKTEILTINLMEIQKSESASNWGDFVTCAVCLAAVAVLFVIVVHLWRETKRKRLHLTQSSSATV